MQPVQALPDLLTCSDVVGDCRVLESGAVGVGGDLEPGGVSEGGVLEPGDIGGGGLLEVFGETDFSNQEALGPRTQWEASVAEELDRRARVVGAGQNLSVLCPVCVGVVDAHHGRLVVQ